MEMRDLAKAIIKNVGGADNATKVENCMTRVRINVKDDSKIDEAALKETDGVLGIVHNQQGYVEVVVGPGKCRQVVDICKKEKLFNGADVAPSSDKSD